MRAAKLETSERLQRVLAVLRSSERATTRQIMRSAHVCAVNSCVAELRENGFEIECSHERVGKRSRFYYSLVAEPANA
ncbi:MAG: helix-turn-helix domain-containing protein [Pseudomonadota bacterium]